MPRANVTLVSFRLGGPDGVSVVAASWARVLTELGCAVRLVAGGGPADVTIDGLGIDATEPPAVDALIGAFSGADLVVVENLCSLPLNRPAADTVATVLRGRPVVLHHHDLPWQRERFATVADFPPTDPAWRHVTINDLSRRQLADRGIEAITIANGFDVEVAPGDREATRAALGIGAGDRVAVHPVRAIARKDVPTAVAVAERLGATYWLLGPPEEGYGPELERVLGAARVPVRRGLSGRSVADAYAAADVVLFPSHWEGFGNPVVESAVHRRPLAIRRYPVARDLETLGFRWFDVDDAAALAALDSYLEAPGPGLVDHNLDVARRHFSLDVLRHHLDTLLREWSW